MQQHLQAHEGKKKKHGANQKLRVKELNTVLETGEKAELYKQFFEINTGIGLYTKRYDKLVELNNKTNQSYKDITEKLAEFEKDYAKNKDKGEVVSGGVLNTPIQEKLLKAQKIHNASSGNYKSKQRTLNMKIKKLEEELGKSKELEMELANLIDVKNDENKSQQLSLNDLQIRAASNQNKKFNHASYSEDLMFITER